MNGLLAIDVLVEGNYVKCLNRYCIGPDLGPISLSTYHFNLKSFYSFALVSVRDPASEHDLCRKKDAI